MSTTERKAKSDRRLSDAIRKGVESDLNRRSLSRIPSFRPVSGLPDQMKNLLYKLDEAEERQAG